MDNKRNQSDIDGLFTDEILFILQEKRTALKVVRIGISIITLLFVAGSFLIKVFIKNGMIQDGYVSRAIIPAGVIIFAVTVYIVVSYIIRIRRLNRKIFNLEKRRKGLAGL